MCGFPVYSNGQATISLWFYNSVQEGDGAILLVVLYCKPYGRVNTVYVLKEALFVGLLVDDNLSNKPLTPAQRSVLAKGPNFAVTPRQPPNLEYITAIEAACTKLSQQDAEELRADINRVLRSSHPPKPNLTKNQMSALRELKKDRDRIVLTADKGVAMVVMDRQDYINKAKHLLNQNTYKTITKDPTNTIKNKLINILKTIKN